MPEGQISLDKYKVSRYLLIQKLKDIGMYPFNNAGKKAGLKMEK